jgi:7-cyano-7-deazaguanine synthase in queuosine biosynthesis
MRAEVRAEVGTDPGVLYLQPGTNLVTGVTDLQRQFGDLTSLETDLMTVAAAVYALDLAEKRGQREEITRDLHLLVPVTNFHAFQMLRDDLTYILYLLTEDNWNIDFEPIAGIGESPVAWPDHHGTTLLFSGGLDSLAAAVDELDQGTALQFASHQTSNPVTRASQRQLYDGLCAAYATAIPWTSVRVTGKSTGTSTFPSSHDRENSQRSRSFLFLTIAAIAARRQGLRRILMIAENGQMAIHLSLTSARIGPFSTHTADPEAIHEMQCFLSALLACPFSFNNPFLYRTKAECVGAIIGNHEKLVEFSVSCWRSTRQDALHCGECIPCIIRRIALERNGLFLNEYKRDLFSLDIAGLDQYDSGKRNLIDLMLFCARFNDATSDAELRYRFPDLVNLHIDPVSAIDMYRRFSKEALSVVSNYPGVQGVLQ